jgi:hypothetical protein
MDLRPCETCGERGFSGASSVVPVDGELCSRYTAPCRRCGTLRTFTFRLPEQIHVPLEPDVSFGGPEPSELLDPGEWLMAADLAAAGAPEADAADLSLAASALDEVLKFIPAGAGEVPPEALRTAAGREVYEREPGRFRRARLAAVAATYREAAGRLRASEGRSA